MSTKAPQRAPRFQGCTRWGGYTREYVKPRVRGFATVRRKRRVRVSIHTWKGIAPGACHYHADLCEETNPALMRDGDRLVWGLAWDDQTRVGRGRKFRNHTAKYHADAVQWVRDTFAREFNKETHRLVTREDLKPWTGGSQ